MISEIEIIIRLLGAFFLGGIIGIEREKRHRPAGLRTHILVSMGSCLIMLTSLYLFEVYRHLASVDPGRIAAGVVTGIGFLGAGAILQSTRNVHGLTTAASIWISSAIGLACGCGFYIAAAVTTLFSLVALVVLKKFEVVFEEKEP